MMLVVAVFLTLVISLYGLEVDDIRGHDYPSDLLADVDESNFDSFIKDSEFVLLDFYLSRKDMHIPSDPITSLCTFLVAHRVGDKLKFGKIETKGNEKLAKQFDVIPTVFPTKILFRNGEVVAKLDPRQRHLYYPDSLEKWVLKRVDGPIQPLTTDVVDLTEGDAIVLILHDTIPQAVADISLNLTNTMFYKLDKDFVYNSVQLLQGGAYVLRNFLGLSSTEPLDLSASKEELHAEITKLTTPVVTAFSYQVFGDIQAKQQWMLGIGIAKSRKTHRGILGVFVDAMKHLGSSLEEEVKGIYIDVDNGLDEGSPVKRIIEFFGLQNPPTVFLFKKDGEDIVKEIMETELTDHNIKSFLFEKIYERFVNKRGARQREVERAKQQKTEAPIPGWKDKKIKPLVGSTLPEWVEQNTKSVMLLLCYEKPSPEISRVVLSLSKIEKTLHDQVDFGKINTEENDIDLPTVPKTGLVLVRKINNQVLTEILMEKLDIKKLEKLIKSKVLEVKEEL